MPLSPDHYSPVNVAHLESDGEPSTLEDLYLNHAESARLIYEGAAQRMGRKGLIPINIIDIQGVDPGSENLSKMAVLDVYSVSSGLAYGGGDVAMKMPEYKQFWTNSETIGVYSAGNSGASAAIIAKQSMSDFGDTVVTVGEAGKRSDGKWEIKKHSEKTGNVTFLAPNITDDGFKIPIFKPPQTLEGQEDWVREAEIWIDARAKAEADGSVFDVEKANAQKDALMANSEYMADLEQRVAGYMSNPEPFHQRVLALFSKVYGTDEKGMGEHVDGTSFCSPYVAEAFGAAKFEGNMRAATDRPTLSSADFVVLAVLSCEPITHLEAGDDLAMAQNDRGLAFNNRAGFGVFTAEKYQQQVEKAYQTLDKNPALASKPKSVQVTDFKHTGNAYVVNIPEAGEMTMLKTRLEYKSKDIPPARLKLTSPEGVEHIISMVSATNPDFKQGRSEPLNLSWGVTDMVLGDSFSGAWKIEPVTEAVGMPRDFIPKDLTLTALGVEKGGLIDVMIENKMGVKQQQKIAPALPTQGNRRG